MVLIGCLLELHPACGTETRLEGDQRECAWTSCGITEAILPKADSDLGQRRWT